MEHRHLTEDSLSLGAIDDIIERGGRDTGRAQPTKRHLFRERSVSLCYSTPCRASTLRHRSRRARSASVAQEAKGRFTINGERQSDSQPVTISRAAQKAGAVANRMRAIDRAADLAPTITQIEAGGATTLKGMATSLDAAGISTPRGQGKWTPTQVARTLAALGEAQGP
jgi:hypothetical protein